MSTIRRTSGGLTVLCACLVLGGCGRLRFGDSDSEPRPDLGTPRDLGVARDSGAGLDVGTELDTGTRVDTGTVMDIDMGTGVDMGTVLTAFGAPAVIPELDGREWARDPTLTADELQIMLVTDAGLRTATRESRTAPWSPLVPVSQFGGIGTLTDPELSGDGLHVFLTVDDETNEQEIYESMRPSRSAVWTVPIRIEELSTVAEDCCASASANRLLLVFASQRGGGGYALYEASRTSTELPWSNIAALTTINGAGNTTNPMLTRGGLTLVFDNTRNGVRDLFYSSRTTLDAPFSSPEAIRELNTDQLERDPWLSENGQRIYFSRGPAGAERIYVAERLP